MWSIMRKALAVGRKEFRQIARDRRSLMVLLFVPAFFLLLYGYALNFDVQNIQLAVHDSDRSQASRELVNAFVESGYFQLAADVSNSREYEELIDRGEVRAVLVLPAGLQRDLFTGRRVPVQVIINGDNSNTATTVMGYALRVLQTVSGQYQVQGAVRGSAPMINVESRVWYNPQLRSALFLIPGLIAYIGMISAVISTSLSVVREKERGTMEQVRMAPLSPLPYIIGKTLPYLVISFVSALLVILSAMLLFELPMRGSWLLLCAAIGLFLIGAQAQGLLISTIAETQQVAFQIALLSSLLPTMILSGFIFPITSMPTVVQWITHIVPARYFLVALRAIVLKGADITAFWEQMMALAIFATVALGLASLRLRREWA
jgi:ABC-2 type transport system permease protein